MYKKLTEYDLESIELIRKFLIKFHKDKDENSLFCRFGKLRNLMVENELSEEVLWNCHLKALKENKELRNEK